jgi:hypothetical protein
MGEENGSDGPGIIRLVGYDHRWIDRILNFFERALNVVERQENDKNGSDDQE